MDLFGCDDCFFIGGGFEGVELCELWMKTDEFALIFGYFFDAEGVA